MKASANASERSVCSFVLDRSVLAFTVLGRAGTPCGSNAPLAWPHGSMV
jgi:hypothetical protein